MSDSDFHRPMPLPAGEVVATLASRHVISARQIEAATKFRSAYLDLRAAREELGLRHYRLLISLIGEDRELDEIAPDKRACLTAVDNLRASLDDLAAMWAPAPHRPPRNGAGGR